MQNTKSNVNSRFKLAQIVQIASPLLESLEKCYSRKCIINEILKDNFNVNQKFNINFESHLQASIHLKNCTALHFLYYAVHDINLFTTFIALGADFTIKNENGQTAFHLMITNPSIKCTTQQRTLFINSVLLAHIKSRNCTNPCDNEGVSHFHGACMANHVEAAELFLDNGASIEETVNCDAPKFAGWTPLHFAVSFNSYKVAQMLVGRGAKVNAKTAKGLDPLDIFFADNYYFAINSSQDNISKKDELMKLLLSKHAVSYAGLSSLQIACTLKNLTMAERLLEEGVDIEYTVPSESSILPGYTALHFAMKIGTEAVKMLLKRGAKFDLDIIMKKSLLGFHQDKYSLQELSDIFSCIESVKEMRLSDGRTKLIDLISAMESLDNFRRFLQNETVDITAVVPSDSVLCAGYTILHLAVTFSRAEQSEFVQRLHHRKFQTKIVEECLNRGLSLDAPNLEEQTPIHLAYVHNKRNIVSLMLERMNQLDAVANLVDKNNLSYLHIACSVKDEALANRLLDASDPEDHRRGTTKSLIQMEAGSTPLHAAASSGSHVIAELLLRRGADLHATDASGMTPIHLLHKHIFYGPNGIVDCLMGSLATNVVDRVMDDSGLSYLHIASACGFVEIVKKLLDLGSNVNAIVDGLGCRLRDDDIPGLTYVSGIENCTPLQLAMRNRNTNNEVLDVLLRRGADIFVNNSNKLAKHLDSRDAPFKNPRVLLRFFQIFWEREDVQKSMEQRFGLTKLHVACYLKDEEAVRRGLTDAVDVNVPVRADSVIFAGCTPLHLLVTVSVGEIAMDFLNVQTTIGSMVKILLDRGADVTLANIEKATPIHVFYKLQSHFLDRDLCKDLLLNAHRDLSVDPVNDEGWSHFHLACYWHQVDVVEKFLQHGSVNVNQPLDYFIKEMAGCTPLHLALSSPMTEPNADWTRLSQTVDLLLKHGADVAAKDVRGSTPLHTQGALYSPGMSVFEKLVSYGGDIKCEDLQGQTPIELLANISSVKSNPSDNLMIFKRYGYKINSWNRLIGEGYIAKIFLQLNQQNLSESSEFQKFMESSDARTVDELGRTAIHNAVAHSNNLEDNMLDNYKYAIESFMKIGVDVEHRDKSGQTALHYAARMENLIGVKALLMCGADVNAVDKSGKSPFSYAMKNLRDRSALGISVQPDVTTILRLQVRKLQHLKLEMSHLNQSFAKQAQSSSNISRFRIIGNISFNLSQTFFSQVEMTKTMDIGINSLTLYDFLSETAALTLYPFLLDSERDLIDHFFDSLDYNELKELAGIIKLQTTKMRARFGMIDTALSSLRMLLGFSVPGLCEQITRFLVNSDLRNLMDSTKATN